MPDKQRLTISYMPDKCNIFWTNLGPKSLLAYILYFWTNLGPIWLNLMLNILHAPNVVHFGFLKI